jgi:predicted acetyltransferase
MKYIATGICFMKNSFISGFSCERAGSGDEEVICRLLALAFGFSRARAQEYVAHVGLSSFRMVRSDSGLAAATAALLKTAHGFGGSDVPAGSIAHVAIAPEARGRGLARPIVEALCEEARVEGALMMSLFGSARPVYRKCGFELAGSEIVYEAETAALPTRTDVDFFPLQPGDDRIRQAYQAKVNGEAGLIRRSEVHWAELLRAPTDGLAVFGAGGNPLKAYVVLDAGDPNVLEIRDWYAENGAMAVALLCLVGRFRSVYPKVRWHGGPHDDLVAAMPDKGWRLAHQEEWMARILDPERALEHRGYRIDSANLGIRIDGPGKKPFDLRLEIASGKAQVVQANINDLPTVVVDEPSFASLFTGFRSASKLARQGVLFGEADAVQLCDMVFAGPLPWVAEHF